MDTDKQERLTQEVLQIIAEMNTTWEGIGRPRQGDRRRLVFCSRVTTNLHHAGKLKDFIGDYEWLYQHQINDAHTRVRELLDQLPALQRHPTKPLLWLVRE